MAVKFSVLVPAYNVESYISRCIESVLGQTYPDYEFIIVNDGSTDNTLAICQEYAATYEVIQLYNQSNRGIAYTRNVLLEKAHGEWVAFVDSDDFIEHNYLEVYEKALSSSPCADVLCADKFEIKKGKKKPISCSFRSKTEYLNQVFDGLPLKRTVCGKIIRKQLITDTGIKFEEGINMGEDILFVSRLFYHAKDIIHVPAYLYNNEKGNEQSMTRAKLSAYTDEKLSYFNMIELFYKSKPDYYTYKEHIDNMHFKIYVDDYLYSFIHGLPKGELPKFNDLSLSVENKLYKLLIEMNKPYLLRVAVHFLR